MYLESLKLKNFRNYKNLDINFSSAINFIVGDNGIGKTNIIEAISILSNIKSFRGVADSEIIKWGESFYFCSAFIKEKEDDFCLEIGAELLDNRIRKKVKIDKQPVKKSKNFFGKFLVIIFAPHDINLINGSPEQRRRFFDSVWSKIDNNYFVDLSDFKKILNSRNKFLFLWKKRETRDEKELMVWNELLAEKSSLVLEKRKEFLKKFNPLFQESYFYLSNQQEPPKIDYLSSFDKGITKNEILNQIKDGLEKEKIMGVTLKGPQRDDYLFCHNKNQKKATDYASQGQKRMMAISIKMTENKIIEAQTSQKAVILVDDIFSELDKIRREKMISFLKQGNQVLFTMANFEGKKKEAFGTRKIFFIKEKGLIEEESF